MHSGFYSKVFCISRFKGLFGQSSVTDLLFTIPDSVFQEDQTTSSRRVFSTVSFVESSFVFLKAGTLKMDDISIFPFEKFAFHLRADQPSLQVPTSGKPL